LFVAGAGGVTGRRLVAQLIVHGHHVVATTFFRGDGIAVIRTPIQAPNANAHAERRVGSMRRDCLHGF
jgi:nucleoside-diphosphate-sugar epimerase